MRTGIYSLFFALAAIVAPASAFVVQAPAHAAVRPAAARAAPAMGPAKDGPFTPAVLFAKVVLGEPTLLKVRGKAISYHSQYINEFCKDCTPRAPHTPPRAPLHARGARCGLHLLRCARRSRGVITVGVPKKMNQALIKKAKVVGSDLGFLS